MAWDFSTDAAYQDDLDWARQLLDDEILPLETIAYDVDDETWRRLTDPLTKDFGAEVEFVIPGGQDVDLHMVQDVNDMGAFVEAG